MFTIRWPLLAAALFTVAPAALAFDGSGPRRWRPGPVVEPWAAPAFAPLAATTPGAASGQTAYIDPATNAIRPGPAKQGPSDFVQRLPRPREFRWGRTRGGYLFIDARGQLETLTVTLAADGTPHVSCGDASHGHPVASQAAAAGR